MYTDCVIPDYGNINQDGYVRVLDKPRSKGGKLKMKHRQEWEKIYGRIPDGYEIHHQCRNRKCCNVSHLECIDISTHKSLTNSTRYKEREMGVLEFIANNPSVTQKVLGMFLD